MGKKQVYNLLYLAMVKLVKYVVMMPIYLCATQLTGFAQFSDTVNYYVNFSGTGNVNRTNTEGIIF